MNAMSSFVRVSCKPPRIRCFNDLIKELHRIFESDSVNIEYVQDVMASYRSNPKEWRKIAKFERNTEGIFSMPEVCHSFNKRLELTAEIGVKVVEQLSGALREFRYIWSSEKHEMIPFKETILHVNDVTYINDSLGLHLMKNRSHSEPAVSLHLYYPPFDQCHIYDQRTGLYSLKEMTFWSKNVNYTGIH
ncbi:cysteine dioxygenase type 1-like [Limulus polyphemus]|uniref:Cysteine dioxygenase n=1 Tax=Limulus polyphemus TaxID=6850 RepID=A0ABM1SV71_LIMPO|nr:cysteine dioxygenase type 1-like [Limulus polyphemus]